MLLAYVVVNVVLVVIWAVSGGGYFWPIWVIGGWGLGVLITAYNVYWRKPISESEIEREQQRLGQ
ncbi:MAG: hypothetical protein GEU88_17445 [Solirubrobacterales bacterium]|nr:hypothetical protein [Solirubrobacterales bacterium]